MYYTTEWDKAAESVRLLAGLEPDLVITGHGEPMRGLEMQAALRELAGNFEQVAVPDRGRYLQEPARAEDRTAYSSP